MKKRIGREMVWLMTPVLGLAGFGWFQTGGPKVPSSVGPMHVEFAPFQTVSLTASDVSQGYDWASETTLKIGGEWDVPHGWNQVGGHLMPSSKCVFVYRLGKKWN